MRRDMVRIYSGEVPEGWREDELRKLVVLKRGYSWEKEQETLRPESGTVPVIRIPNVQGRLILTPMLYLRGISDEDLKLYGVSKGWVLFVASNGNEDRIGDSALIEQDMQMVFASFLMGMTPREPDKLLPEFLALWMKLHWVHELFSKTSQKSSGLGNFSWGAVKRLPLRYPDPEIQQEIVRIVKLADQYLFLTSSQTLYLREIDSSSANRLTNDHGVSSNVDAKDVERGNAARMESDTNIEDAPSPEDAGTRCDGVFSDKSELNTALRLRFCLIEDLVTGRRPISARLTSGGVS